MSLLAALWGTGMEKVDKTSGEMISSLTRGFDKERPLLDHKMVNTGLMLTERRGKNAEFASGNKRGRIPSNK